ncbi:MAG: hypothetical protein WAR79_08795 [Melioribacteraceae bacterium]
MNNKILYKDDFIKKSDLLFYITKEDLQHEVMNKLNRKINDIEMNKGKDMLEWGIGENINIIYNEIINSLEKKSK